ATVPASRSPPAPANALALAVELLDDFAGLLDHLVVIRDALLVGERAVADHDLGLVVGNPQPVIGGADHAADVAAIEEVDLLIAMVVVHDVAGGDHVGVGKIDA